MRTELLVPMPVVLPLAGAAVVLALVRTPRVQRAVTVVALLVSTLTAGVLLATVHETGPRAEAIGGRRPPLGITLVADRLSALLLVVSMVVVLAILLYSAAEERAGRSMSRPAVFYPVYLTLAAGISMAFLSGDLFNLFVGFEVMLSSSFVLITLAPNRDRLRAAMTYVVVSITSSLLFLTGVALLYMAAGTVNLADLVDQVDGLTPGLRTAFGLYFLVVFGIKAAVVPLHLWLPDSYPLALTKITALFAALLTKVAVYAMIRTQTLLFPRDDLSLVILVLAAVTMVVGLLGSLVQDDLNRLLSFVLVGHIGYLLFGLGLFSVAGLTGSILYLVHHIVVQASLFLVSGLVYEHAGTDAMSSVQGLARSAPLVAGLFFLPALSVSGVPPLTGFIAKLSLLQAAAASGRAAAYAVAVVAVVASLLTLVVMARVWVRVFWGRAALKGGTVPRRTLWSTSLVTASLIGFGLVLVAFAGPLAEISRHAAEDLLDTTTYRRVVLDAGLSGEGTR